MQSKETYKISLTNIIALMTVSVPILYVIGYFYEQGWVEGFGLNEQFFPKSVHDYLISSFFVLYKVAADLFAYAITNYYVFIPVSIIMFVTGILALYYIKNETQIDRKIEK